MVGVRRNCQDAAGELPSAPERAVVKYPALYIRVQERRRGIAMPCSSPPAGSVKAIAFRWGAWPLETGRLRNAGTCPRSRERTPTETSRSSAHGPVGVESDLPAESSVFMARGGPDPGLLPLSWHWVRARAGAAGTLCGFISFPA